MPSFQIHLAIAKRYMEKNHVLNKTDFYDGSVVPDLTTSKSETHYSNFRERTKDNLYDYLKNKVNLKKFLDENRIDTDYNRGVFLHLVTDYLFYTAFFDEDYLKHTNHEIFAVNLYYSYDLTNEYIFDKYNVNFKVSTFAKELERIVGIDLKAKDSNLKTMQNILEFDKLDAFIEKVSDINLDEYADKIMI